MKKLNFFSVIACAIILIASACQDQNENDLFDLQKATNQTLIDKNEIALEVVSLLNDQSARSEIFSTLENYKIGLNLGEVLDKVEQNFVHNQSTNKLREVVKRSEEMLALDKPDFIEVPELWLHTPNVDYNQKDVLISFAPDGEEENWDKIKAYTLQGDVVYLDPNVAPNVPVIVVENNGYEALQIKVELMNERLKEVGLQRNLSAQKAFNTNARSNGGLETTVLDNIRLNDDKEPWIKGSAEIYAVTSGIRSGDGSKEPEIKIIGMAYLDKDGKTYYPNQIMLFWDDYDYQAANIQLFEQDSNYSYEELVSIIVQGVFTITGIITEQPWLPALAEIADAIIRAMPDDWWVDNDDYVDSYYTIMKNQTYSSHYGAGGNARVSMSPLFIPNN